MSFEAGKTYATRAGLKARIYATDGLEGRSIHGAIYDARKHWELAEWAAEGTAICGRASWDLMPEEKTMYLNIYPDGFTSDNSYPTREDADSGAGATRTACIRVDYYEGQFDE